MTSSKPWNNYYVKSNFLRVKQYKWLYKRITTTLWWHHYDVISWFCDSKFPYFLKLVIRHQPAKFQMPQLSESNCTEVFIGHPKNLLWRHYDVSSEYLAFKIAYLVELNKKYKPLKDFIGVGCLDKILQGLVESTPCPDLHALKKPSPYKVNIQFPESFNWGKSYFYDKLNVLIEMYAMFQIIWYRSQALHDQTYLGWAFCQSKRLG